MRGYTSVFLLVCMLCLSTIILEACAVSPRVTPKSTVTPRTTPKSTTTRPLATSRRTVSARDYLGSKYKYEWKLLKPAPKLGNMLWSDGTITVSFLISDTAVNFKLYNRTQNVIKVIWDEASIVQFGEAKKIMHQGIKYAERMNAQPPAAIPPGASISDFVLPTENVYWSEGYYGRYYSRPGEWKQHDLFATHDLNEQSVRDAILKSKGTTFSLYLPIQYQGETLDYSFTFQITDVQAVEE